MREGGHIGGQDEKNLLSARLLSGKMGGGVVGGPAIRGRRHFSTRRQSSPRMRHPGQGIATRAVRRRRILRGAGFSLAGVRGQYLRAPALGPG